MNIIVIVHNQKDLLIRWLNDISETSADISRIVIVDNFSQDGLGEVLKNTSFNYVLCDEKIETYSVIVNMVIREFQMSGQVFVTSPQYLPSYDMLINMENILEESGNIPAVSPARYIYEDNLESVNMTEVNKNSSFQSTNLNPMCVMYQITLFKQLGSLDEELNLSDMAMKDYIFRAVSRGLVSVQIESVVFLVNQRGMDAVWESMLQNHDREILKAKWNMNYFNTLPNWNLISMISCDINANVNILEVGCDCGANLLEIQRRYKNSKLYGVEINEDAAAIASKILNVKVGNIEEQNLDFGDVKFDYIIFGDVLEHLHAPERTVAYCRTLLKRGGRIIASIPNVAHYSVIQGLLTGNFMYGDSGLLDRTHIHLFAFNDIIRMFTSENYIIEMIKSIYWEDGHEGQQLVDYLMSISPGAERHIFTTFQYLVSAVKNDEV